MIEENIYHMLLINSSCNSNCIFCYGKSIRNKYLPSYEEIEEKINSLVKEKAEGISINGGEPSINKNFIKIIKYSIKKKLKVNVVTNGRIFSDKEKCKILKKLGVSRITLSLHGNSSKVHDLITQTKKSFNEALNAIKNFSELNMPLSINTVVTKYNVNFLEEIYHLIMKINPNIKVNFLYPTLIDKYHICCRYEDIFNNLKDIIYEKNVTLVGFPLCYLNNQIKFCLTRHYDVDKIIKNASGNLTKVKFNEKCRECKFFFNCSPISEKHSKLFNEFPKECTLNLGKYEYV